MSPAAVRRLLRLYPARWRERYEAEFAALLEVHPPSIATIADVVAGAIGVRVYSKVGSLRAEHWIEHTGQDIRYALRSLKRAPAFALSATVTLAIGLGSATAMFAVVHGVLLKALPYGDASRLVAIEHEAKLSAAKRIPQSSASYFTYKRLARSIESIGLYRVGTGNVWVGDEPSEPEQVTVAWMTASTIATLKTSPILGRAFNDEDDRPNAPWVVIISEAEWHGRFGGARDVLGKTIYVNSVPRRVIGVMPDWFRFPTPEVRLWLPTRLDASSQYAGDFAYSAVARLRPHVTPEVAQRDLASVLPRIAESFPKLDREGMPTARWLEVTRVAPVVIPLRDAITGGIAQTLWMLAVAAGLVLFVACASVANLMLIRADERQLELAVREALGAGRWRVLSQVFVESTLLSVFAGAVGLSAAWACVRALVAFGPADIPRLAELDIDSAAIGFTVLISLVASGVGGVLPTLHVVHESSFASLRENGRAGTGRARQRLRRTIASVQIALALVALAGSGLLLRTFQELRDVRPGFDATNVTTLWVQLPFARYRDSAVVRFAAALTERVRQLPGIEAAGITSRIPLVPGSSQQNSFTTGATTSPETQQASLQMYNIDDGYLAAMHIPLVAGRRFEKMSAQRDLDVIINREAARTLWGDRSGRAALGRRLSMVTGGPWYTVIGVVEDVRDDELSRPSSPTVYFPQAVPTDTILGRPPRHAIALVVRTAEKSNSAVTVPIKDILHDLDPTLPVFDVQTMSEILRASTTRLSTILILMGAAAVITLVLGAIGLYGVTAYVVTLRRRELGLRIALGAEPKRIVMMMTRQGITVACIGVTVGVPVFAAIARFLRTFLYGVAPSDPMTLLGAVITLLLIAALASWLPARRAAMIDPADTLRAE